MGEVYSPEREIESKTGDIAAAGQHQSAHMRIKGLAMLQGEELFHTVPYTAMLDPAGMYKLYTHFNNNAGEREKKKLRKTYLFSMLILINLLAF